MTKPKIAVIIGPMAIVTRTLATLVKVSATMNAVNMTHQHTPEIQKARPPWATFLNTARPWKNGKITNSDRAVNSARQKVISKLRADSR